jgi:microcystin-dependent protein
MAYEINFTDSVNKGSITVEDNSINTETSLGFPGRNLSDYGKVLIEDLLHLLENFANNNPPNNPVEGQLWYDTTSGIDQLKVYDGSQWVSAGGWKKAVSVPDAANSTVGDVWIDTSNQQVYLYSGSGWILVGPTYAEGANTGAKFETVIGTDNIEYPVIINYADSRAVTIISSSTFTPKSTIVGFSIIYPGVNISGNLGGAVGKYYGTAEKAENLIVDSVKVPASEFVRKNVENILTKPLRIRTNSGLDIGETQTLLLQVEGSAGIISHRATGSNIDIRVNNAGTIETAIRVKSDKKVGVNNTSPTEQLDVGGNIKASGGLVLGSTTQSTSISSGSLVVAGGAGVAKNLYVGGDVDASGTVTTHNIVPDSSGIYSIGTTANKYNFVYANGFYGNVTGNLTGNISGSASSSGKLASVTTFTMTGDVTSPSFTFDGQTGGTTKTFTTTLSDTYFTSKSTDSTIASSDEILIYRAGTGIRRVSQELFVSTVPTFYPGMIMPFGGTTAPAGWMLCDGSEISISTYGALYTAIGTNFGVSGSPTTLFKLPDFRGRFLLGHLGSATTGIRVLNDGAAETVGNYGGAESSYITKNQLPQHEHSLQGDSGTQFYALTNVTGATDSDAVSVSITGGAAGSGLPRTEGVDGETFSTVTINGVPQEVGDPLYFTSPFGTVNYIIYHGVV